GRGEEVDARSDLFSLGCVLYRMLTGRLPFQGKDMVSTLVAVASHEPAPPANLGPGGPRGLSALVMRLLAHDPPRRPASADEVAAAQGRLEEAERRRRPPGARSGRWRMALAVAVGLAALVPLGWWLAVTVLRVETANGTLVVEIDDDAV